MNTTEKMGPKMRAALARLDAIESRQAATEKRVAILESEGEAPVTSPAFTTTTWQDEFPFDPEAIFGNVDDYPYQTRVGFIQVRTEDNERYVWPIMAIGMRDHSGRLTTSEENRRKRGYHLFHEDRTGLGLWWDHQRGDSTVLIRDGRVLQYPLGPSPSELRAMPDPWTVDVTDRFEFGSLVELPDPEAWTMGIPDDFPTELEPGTIAAHYPIVMRTGPLRVVPVMVDEDGTPWLSTNGDHWTVGKMGEDIRVDVEAGKLFMGSSDWTQYVRFGPEVRSIVEWPT